MNSAEPEKNMTEENDNDQEIDAFADDVSAEQELGSAGASKEGAVNADDASRAKIEALQVELDNAKDHMLRVLADAENTKKRALRDRDDAVKYAVTAFAKDLLDFSDNFGRALDSIPDELLAEDERIGKIVSGIEAMNTDLLATFEKHGIQKLTPIDEAFDPNFHEVMFEASAPDKAPGTIIQIIEPGYMLHGRLLRPARVGIAKNEGQGGDNTDPGSRIDREV